MAYTNASKGAARSPALKEAQRRYRQNHKEELNKKRVNNPERRRIEYLNSTGRREREAYQALKALFK